MNTAAKIDGNSRIVIDKPKKKRQRKGWSEGAELAVLELWNERVEELRAERKTGHIYAEMSEELLSLGYCHTPRHVQVKIQNFSQRYKKEKDEVDSTGLPSFWMHFDRVQQIIGGFKSDQYKEEVGSNDGDSSKSSSSTAPLPKTPPASSAPANPLQSPEPPPSPSAGKATQNGFQDKLLAKFDSWWSEIADHMKRTEELEKERNEIERKKVEIQERDSKDNQELRKVIIDFLNK